MRWLLPSPRLRRAADVIAQRRLRSLLLLALAGCGPLPPEQEKAAAPAPMIDVAELGVADAQRRMAAGELTSHQLTQAYLDRIQAIDRQVRR